MSFPRYESYKDSGVEWLGEVPEHWEVKRVKNVANINMGQSPSSQDCNQDGNGAPFLQGNADFGETNPFPRHFCSVANKLSSTGDILFSVRAPVGAINISDQIYGIGRGLCAFTPNKFNFVKFFFYALEIVKSELFSVATGSTYEAVSVEQIANAIFIAPPIIEQNAIAQFLDQETTKIDNLIAEQQQLIKLLKEKRQAVISHAVTKGLNPDVPMKDSGVEWLGEVPEHWDIKRLKYIKSNQANAFVDGPFGSNLKSEHFIENGDAYVIESNFATQGKLNLDKLKTISSSHFLTIRRSEVKETDLVIAKIGAQFGKVSILPYIDKPAVVSGNSMKLTVSADICEIKWAYLQLQKLKEIGEMELLVNGSAQPALSLSGMNQLIFLLPPKSEQTIIIDTVETKTQKFETLIAESTSVISLLKERRSALISSAVTGKIDVRNYVPTQSQVEAMA